MAGLTARYVQLRTARRLKKKSARAPYTRVPVGQLAMLPVA